MDKLRRKPDEDSEDDEQCLDDECDVMNEDSKDVEVELCEVVEPSLEMKDGIPESNDGNETKERKRREKKSDPSQVPTKGKFFEHDSRDSAPSKPPMKSRKGNKKLEKVENVDAWPHDFFVEGEEDSKKVRGRGGRRKEFKGKRETKVVVEPEAPPSPINGNLGSDHLTLKKEETLKEVQDKLDNLPLEVTTNQPSSENIINSAAVNYDPPMRKSPREFIPQKNSVPYETKSKKWKRPMDSSQSFKSNMGAPFEVIHGGLTVYPPPPVLNNHMFPYPSPPSTFIPQHNGLVIIPPHGAFPPHSKRTSRVKKVLSFVDPGNNKVVV